MTVTKTVSTAVIFGLMLGACAGIGSAHATRLKTADDAVQLDVPETQKQMAERVLPILKEIDNAEDPQLRRALESKLYPMIEGMLEAGIAPSIWHDEDPSYWNERRSQALPAVDSERVSPEHQNSDAPSNYTVELYQSSWCCWGLMNCSTV